MSFGGSFLAANEEERRELVHNLIRLARPDAKEEHLRIG